MATAIEVTSLFGVLELQDRASGTLRNFDTQMDSVEQRLSRFGGQMQSMGAGMVAMSAPVIGFAAAGVRAAVQFESAFAGVRKTVDATEAEFDALQANITRLATSSDHATSALGNAELEMARIMELAGQLGVRGVDDLTKFTETVGMLGMTTNLSTETAATELARFANVVGMPISDVDRLGSSIVALGNNFATTEAEIVEMMQRIGGAGNVIGLSESQIAALATALSSLGINPEAGGTAISRVMLSLFSAVGEGGDDLEAFARVAGKSAAEFAESFKTAPAQAINSFISGLRRLHGEGQNVANVLESLGMGDIRVRDTMLRLATGTDVLTGALELSASAWDANTALIDEAGKRAATTESAMNRLGNNLRLLRRVVGEALLPALNAIIDRVVPIVQAFAEWAKANPALVQGIVAVAGAVAGLGTGLATVGTLIRLAAPAIALLTGPLGMVAAGVAATVAGLGVFASVLGVDVLGGLEAVGRGISIFIQDVQEAGIGEALLRAFGLGGAGGESWIEAVLVGFGMAREQAEQVVQDIAGFVDRFVRELPITLSLIPFYAQYYFGMVWSRVQPLLQPIIDWFTGSGDNSLNGVMSQVGAWVTNNVIDPLKGIWIIVQPHLQDIADWFDSDLRPIIEAVPQWLQDNLVTPLQNLWGVVQPFVQPLIDFLGGIFNQAADTVEMLRRVANPNSPRQRALPGEQPIAQGETSMWNLSPVDQANVDGWYQQQAATQQQHTNPINWQTGLPFPTLTESYDTAAMRNLLRDSGGRGQAGQPYLIGRGAQPELFVPDSAGTFYPNASRMGGGRSVQVGNMNFYITDGDPEKLKQAVFDAIEELGQ